MVAVVSGSGLGLFNSSTSTLGGAGASGNSQVGRGRDQVYVNTTTGNLVVQSVDETLSALGLDFAGVRTYNSQGLTDEDNNDQWRLGVHQRVHGLTGTVNTAGSTVRRVFGDGAEVVYTYNTTRARYESGEGDGANDFLTWNAGNSRWTWTNGSSRATEEFGLVNSVQRILFSRDADGNTVTYNYTGSLLTSIAMAGATAQTVFFDYTDTGAAANNIRAVRVVSNGVTQTLTRYTYDGSQRLQTVVVDLTPANTADSVTYTTTYTYDGTSKRIASITQSDGSSVTFTYQQINGDYRLRTVTDAENRTTTFTYTDVTTSGGTGGTPVAAPANTGALSNQDTVNLPRNDAALTTNATQTTPYTRNDGALSTTDSTSVNYNRNDSALTTPAGGGGSWGYANDLEFMLSGQFASSPQFAFDANGNGFAAWSMGDQYNYISDVRISRYTRATNSWSAPEVVSNTWSNNGPNPSAISLAMDGAGNAILGWTDGIGGNSQFWVQRYSAATGTWSAPLSAESGVIGQYTLAINGSNAALAITSMNGMNGDLHVRRFNGTTWSARESLETRTNSVLNHSLTMDSQGNVALAWAQSDGTATSAWTNRWTQSSATWSGAVQRDTSNTAVGDVKIAFDGNGNGFAVWAQGADLMMSRYTRSNNTWTTATAIDSLANNVSTPVLSVDNSGNAIVAWIQNDAGGIASVFTKRYSNASSTWSAVAAVDTASTAVASGAGNLSASINGNVAAVSWVEYQFGATQLMVSTFNGTAWSTPYFSSNADFELGATTVSVDAFGNANLLFRADDLYNYSATIRANRFTAGGGGGGTPYYTVPSGATWQSIANAVYGINSAAAGSALQTALGNPALTTGAQLTGFPATLTVVTTITVPAYYTIPAGATWQSIANAVYGINSAAAGTALQTAMSNPALTAGNRLTNFPATLSVTTTLAPHYLVPAGASWQSIANALYGSAANNTAGANALQTALGNPSIASGQRLYSIPATLGVTTTVPYFYTVQSGNTWSGITQSIYGTTDANAITALQTALGTSTLTVGARLTVPMTLNYTTGGAPGQSIYLRTDVLDALGLTTTYLKDAAGRIISVQTPSVGGVRLETRYTYDTVSGNVATIVEDPTGLNRVTTLTYDAVSGLLLSTRDSLGNTVSRTYTANNQLETETSYLVRDPDGAGTGQPSSPLVSRFIYDGENHLRFAISADGRVTEHVYDAPGQRTTTYKYAATTYSAAYTLSALEGWAPGQRANALERFEYTYDFRGNVSTVTQWATTNASGVGTGAASTTRFVYDQRGLLLSTVEARGEATSSPTTDYVTNYTYDGLGRMLVTSAWVSGTETARQVQAFSYDDANRRTVITFANGLTKTSNYNRSGELTSVVNGPSALGTTAYAYDGAGRLRVKTDPTGVREYNFYDDANRLVGKVDGDGSLTEFIYDRANQLIKTVRYATLLSSATQTSLAGGSWSTVAFSALRTEANATPANNQIQRNVYDVAGQIAYSVDEIGAVTRNIYDGAGRLTDSIRYFNTQTIAASVDEVLPAGITVATNASDRRVRYFYNGDGQLIGTLDGAGFLKENVYDAAGRLTAVIGYFAAVDGDKRDHLSLSTMRPGSAGSTAQLDPARDITSRFFYDAQGRRIGELDGEGYLTESVYDVADNVLQEIHYGTALTFTPGTSTFTTLRTTASAGSNHTTTYTYDGLGQVLTETNFENTQTLFTYDVAGNVISVSRANGVSAEVRTTQMRFNVLGQVTQELSAEGTVALAALGGSPTQAQIDDVWNRWGVTHTYDTAGRRTSTTVRPNDTQTNTSYFYYDNDGRLRFTLDPRGRVSENRYNALGQRVDSIEYYRTASVASPQGGLLTSALIATLTGTEAANVHERKTFGYSARGEVTSTSTAAGMTTASTFNVFGELQTHTAGSGFTAYEYTYDARGLQKLTRRGGTTFQDRSYDAFGRLTGVVDARGNSVTTAYDRLGREISTLRTGDANASTITYDGYSRVLTTRDRLLNTTSYLYTDSSRTVTVTTPENIVITTVYNRHGDEVSVTAAGNTTTFQYDRNGELTGSSDSLGALEGRSYDRAGRQVTGTDARGTITTFAYDAADRTISRTVDSAAGGQQLVTTYTYDTQNRILDVTEPGNRLTRTQYDRDGRVSAVTVDPNGTPSRMEYVYDSADNLITVTEGAGSSQPRRTRYVYDALGRRTDEYVDPISLGGTLDLRTQYRYDNNGNVTRKIDARGNSTWYVYDAQNRVSQEIDALGGVTQSSYDAEDRLVATRRHFNTVSTGSLGDAPGTQSVAHTPSDQVTRSVYDREGRERYTIETLSATGSSGNVTSETAVVTERTFDANGNVTRTRVYRNAIAVSGALTEASVASALTAAGNNTAVVHAADRVERMLYDVRGRLEIRADGSGAVTRYLYDLNGNVTQRTEHAGTVAIDGSDATLRSLANALSHGRDRVTRFWYDTTDRERFALDGEGYLVESRYLDATRQEQSIVYAGKPSIAANATLANVVTAAATAPNQAGNQVTTQTFDVAGRLVQVNDANNRNEYFAYDALDNRIRFVNKKATSASDAAYTWTYEYDANGRLVYERSPAAAVTTVTETGATLTATTNASLVLVTHNFYDALGNVTSRVEAEGTTQARTTSFEYDALGRQTASITPTVGLYNASTGDTDLGNGSAVQRRETQDRVRSETAYDVFGNAYRNRLVTASAAGTAANGSYTYKAYDNLGRVKYEVDARNQLTSFSYDVFGNQTEVTRHSATLSSALSTTSASISLADVESRRVVTADSDRTLQSSYDRLGRAVSIRQPSADHFIPNVGSAGGTPVTLQPTVEHSYNAFGQVVMSRELTASGTWVYSYSYYDRRGLKTAELDPSRYLTQYFYDDETGDLTRQLEYARPTTGSVDVDTFGTIVTSAGTQAEGADRETRFTYDKLNRKVTEERVNLEYSTISGGNLGTTYTGSQTTTYGYDVLGNQTLVRVADPNNSSAFLDTYTYYDVLGRAIAVAEPQRDLGNAQVVIPLTRMWYDAHGNMAQRVEYFYGTGTIPSDGSMPAAYSPNATVDRTTTMLHDARNNVLRSEDPNGADRHASYNTRGDAAKEWQVVVNPNILAATSDDITDTVVTLYRYDPLGQQTEVVESQRYNGASTATATRIAEYNAFGEITAKYNQGVAAAERTYYHYDKLGRVWRTNADDGVDKVFQYDLQGNATVELRSRTVDLGSLSYGSAAAVVANVSAAYLIRTESAYDLDGNVIARRMPTFEISSGLPPVGTNLQLTTINGSAYINWIGTLTATVTETFEYRPVGSTGAWTPVTIEQISAGVVGANIHSIYNAPYEYRIRYSRGTEASVFAESTGTFRIDRSTNTNFTSISVTPQDTSLDVAPIAIQQSGPLNLTATYGLSEAWNGFSWMYDNVINVDLTALGNTPVMARVQYTEWDRDYPSDPNRYRIDESPFIYLASAQGVTSLTWRSAYDSQHGGIISGRPLTVWVWAQSSPGVYNQLVAQTGATAGPPMLIWTAPADTSVTATFKYKLPSQSTYSSVQAQRFGGQFRIDVANLLTSTSAYDYEIEYVRSGEVVSRRGGQLNSTGVTTTRYPNGTISDAALAAWSQNIPTPLVGAGYNLQWSAPPSTFGTVTATFGIRTNGSSGAFSPRTITTGAPYSVYLGDLPQNQPYEYQIVYTLGGRTIAEQRGVVTMQFTAASTTTNVTGVAVNGAPTVINPVAAVAGVNGVGPASGVPNGTQPTYVSGQGGGYWMYNNEVDVSFATVPASAGQYVRIGISFTWTNGFNNSGGPSTYLTSVISNSAGTGSRHITFPAYYVSGDPSDQNGRRINAVTAVNVYLCDASGNNLVAVRSTGATGSGSSAALQWAAPTQSGLTTQFYVNGTLRSTSASGSNLLGDVAGYTGTNNFEIRYFRSGDPEAIVSSSGQFTSNGITTTLVPGSQTYINRNPSWIPIAANGNTVTWSRVADQGSFMRFEYSTDAVNYTPLSIIAAGDNTNFSASVQGFNSGRYYYRLVYASTSSGVLPYVKSEGYFDLVTTVVNNTTVLDRQNPHFNQQYGPARITPVTLPANSDVVSWSYPKNSAGDTVRFFYTVGGTEYTVDLSGNAGPNFSAAMSALPIAANQSVTWRIEYRSSGLYPYAMANGSATITVTGTQQNPVVSVLSQELRYPSGVQQLAAPTDLGGNYLGWSSLSPGGATVRFYLNGVETALETAGAVRRINLASLGAGSYSYELTYTNGASNPHARVRGSFTVTKSPGGITGQTFTIAPPRPESTFDTAPTISTMDLVWPPGSLYYEYINQGGPQYLYGPRPYEQGGGWVQEIPPSAEYPNGQYRRNDPPMFKFFAGAQAITWPRVGGDENIASLVYWSTSTPNDVKTTSIGNYNGIWAAYPTDQNGFLINLANGTYGYRIEMRRSGAAIPWGIQQGTFVRSNGAYTSITPTPNTTPVVQTVTPTSRQTFDRWGNLLESRDASNNLTNYRYNARSQLVQSLEATDKMYRYSTTGGATDVTGRAEKTNFYDALGRLIETQDGYDQATRVTYNGAGQLISQRNADYVRYNATSTNVYDIFGNVLQTTDEIGFRTRYKYDKGGRVIEVWREITSGAFTDASASSTAGAIANLQVKYYKYDEQGRRVSETNGVDTEVMRYRYDHRGNVIARISPLQASLGQTTSYTYDINGKMITETDGLGSVKSWSYNSFGRLLNHTELTNANTYVGSALAATITYNYDEAGLMTSETSNRGKNVQYGYDVAGNLTSINDITVNRQTLYRYDAAGRRARDSVFIDGRMHQDVKISYDGHNRVSGLDDPDYREVVWYDANGNRSYVGVSYIDHTNRVVSDTLSYTYDEMNRVLTSTHYTLSAQMNRITRFTYNGRGDRLRAISPETGMWERRTLGGTVTHNVKDNLLWVPVTEDYTYDGLGRLKTVTRDVEHVQWTSAWQLISRSYVPTQIRSYEYDKANRVYTDTYTSFEGGAAAVNRATTHLYDLEGRASESTTRRGANTESVTRFGRSTWNGSSWSRGYDDAGNVRGYEVANHNPNNGNLQFTATYKNSYQLGESYLETQQSVNRSDNPSVTNYFNRYYNANAELTTTADSTDANRNRYYANNQNGQALTVINGNFAGQSLTNAWDASIVRGNYGNFGHNYAKGQYYFFANGNMIGTFGQLQKNGTFEANFDVNYTPISDAYPSAVPSTIVAQAGDTLRSIAAKAFGDASLWYVIAEENGLTNPDEDLPDGMQLRIPNEVISLSNTSNSFKPFNPSDAIGDTNPTMPDPPAPKGGCGVIGMIIMIVVMVVVTIFTAGVAAGLMGTMASSFSGIMAAGATALTATGAASLGFAVGAAVGAISSVVTQGIGMALGIQDKFDWKQVAVGAITGGVGGGLARAGLVMKAGASIGSKMLAAGVNAVVSNTLTQGVSIAVGLQKKFDWKSVAQSAVAAPLAAAASHGVASSLGGENALNSPGYNLTKFASGAASSLTTSAVRAAMGGKFEIKQVLADVFGNAIGNAIVDTLAAPERKIQGSVESMKERGRLLGRSVDEKVAREIAEEHYYYSKHRDEFDDDAQDAQVKKVMALYGETQGDNYDKVMAALAAARAEGRPKVAEGWAPDVVVTGYKDGVKPLTGLGRILSDWQDPLATGGRMGTKLGELIEEHWWAKLGLAAVEAITTPVLFVARRAFEHSPIGRKFNEFVETGFEKATNWVNETARIGDSQKAGEVLAGIGLAFGLAVAGVAMFTKLAVKAGQFFKRLAERRKIDADAAATRRQQEIANNQNRPETQNASPPTEPYNRKKHYGTSPTKADRKAAGAGKDEVLDHDPPLVKRYYEGDPKTGEKPGYLMTKAERKASAADRERMDRQPRTESDAQGADMSRYSREQKKKHGL